MQIMKCFIRLAVFLCPVFAFSQSTYIPLGSKAYDFIDRMEIKLKNNSNINFSSVKPYSRKAIVKEAELFDSLRTPVSNPLFGGVTQYQENDLKLTRVDEYNLNSLLMNNAEWVTKSNEEFESRRPFLNVFYKTKANMLEVNSKDFFLAINPILNLQYGTSSGNNTTYLNTRGVTARGLIANRVGFSGTITENQEKGPQFFQDRVNQFGAVPGVGFYKAFKTNGVDYFDARGYITFNAAKYIDFQFGYDKNFIGDGYRSLLLSDYGNSYLFFKINTKIWKFNYQNIFAELMPQFKKGKDTLLDRKYTAIHHLSMDVTKWLNIGLFEGVIFGRKNHFDFQYLNPIIFYRHIEGTIGSPDNAVAGLDFKAKVAHTAQLYGQLLLDEFVLSQLKKNTGSWVNKYAVQLGVKYVDAFKINNLDLQLEANIARPFTYSHNDTIANYTHYNQPLAHPLGGNFREFIGIVKYQPVPKLYFNGRLIYYVQGLDSLGRNFGSNPLKNYVTRPRDLGFYIGSGYRATCLNASLVASYELKENLFIDATALLRNFKVRESSTTTNTKTVSIGIRWNIGRRDYDY
ncbi:MAG: hypothetical protein H0W75_06425 [Chitinophagaceae bacterium]|nr:hypothetical protein [Chitinophagaceae bacterium]